MRRSIGRRTGGRRTGGRRTAAAGLSRSSARPARSGDARQELALPDLRGHRRNEFVDNPAPAIDEERFRRPVNTPIDGGTAVLVEGDRGIGISQLFQPLLRLLPL